MSRAQDLIKRIMEQRGVNYAQVSDMLGETAQLCRQRMAVSSDIKAEMFYDMLEALGYEISFQDIHIMKVSQSFADRLKVPEISWHYAKPRGLFYTEKDGIFEVTDTRDGGYRMLTFLNKAQMMEWVETVMMAEEKASKKKKMA